MYPLFTRRPLPAASSPASTRAPGSHRITAILLAVSLAGAALVTAVAAESPETFPLWHGQAPTGQGNTQAEDAEITIHRPSQPNGAAMVICPGGGYGGLVMGPEGHGIAQWLNAHGITGVVLKYRLPKGRAEVPLLDAQRALRYTRAHSQEWGLDAQRIGIIGFSAGGHLAATAGTHFDAGDAGAADPLQRVSCRPDFLLLIYPVISMGPTGHGGSRKNLLGSEPTAEQIKRFSNETQVTVETPPAFLAHARNDTTVSSAQSQMFFDALQAVKVPAKFLELPEGGHGLNGYRGPMWEAWQRESLQWLVERKMIPAESVNPVP